MLRDVVDRESLGRLKSALREIVAARGVSYVRLAAAIGVSDTHVREHLLKGDAPIKAAHLRAWEPLLGRQALAQSLVEAFFPGSPLQVVQPIGSAVPGDVMASAGAAAKEGGEALAASGEILADGRVMPSEAERGAREHTEAAAAHLRAAEEFRAAGKAA